MFNSSNSDIKKAAKKNGKRDKAPRGAEVRKDFDALFNTYADRIYTMAFIYIKKPDDTMELTEEVFIKLLLRKKDFQSEAETTRWLFRTAHVSIMDYFRIKMRKKIRLQDMQKMNLYFKPDKLLNDIFMLPDKLKSALYLKYSEGMDEKEIGRIISNPVSLVGSKLSKAEGLLKEGLKSTDVFSNRVKSSLDIIKVSDNVREHIYFEVQRKFQDKAFISKAKFSYKKHVLDKYIPFIAAGCIAVAAFAFFAVENGWLTGQKFVESTELAEQNGYVYEGEDETLKEVMEYYGVTPNPESSAAAEASSKADVVITMKSYDSDKTFTLTNFESDAFALWDELVSNGSMPSDIKLNSYSVDSTDAQNEVLVLDFDEAIKSVDDVNQLVSVISEDFLAAFPDYASVRVTVGGTVVE